MNALFGSEFASDQVEAFVLSIVTLLAAVPDVRERVRANSEDQFVASERIDDRTVDAVLSSDIVRDRLTALTLAGDLNAKQAIRLIKHAAYRYIRAMEQEEGDKP